MSDQDNQSEFDFDGESAKKVREVFGIKRKKNKDYERFKQWYNNWLKEKKENNPPE